MKLTRQQRIDLLITALEGGSNYWYFIDEPAEAIIHKACPSDGNLSFAERMFIAMEAGNEIEIHDAETGDSLGSISMKSMAEAEEKITNSNQYLLGSILKEEWDASDADIWFQYAVMGEIVFG